MARSPVARRTPAALLLAFSFALAPAARAGLTPAEARLSAWVDLHAAEAEALVEELANVNSGTLNPAGVRQVGDRFARELAALGFTVRWIDMPAEMHRAGHLVAERSGDAGPRVLLLGHLDTVHEPSSPFQKATREGRRLHGPGTEDMKGGDVVLLQALRALDAEGLLAGHAVTVVLTGDEEKTGEPLELARRDLVAAAGRADVALNFEAGVNDLGNTTVARRGASGWKLEVTAPPAHSSGIFDPRYGYGAIFEAARILDGFRETLAGEKYLTVNPAAIVGGTEAAWDPATNRGSNFAKINVIAAKAVVEGDLRFLSEAQKEGARERMRAIVAAGLPLSRATITFTDGYPAMEPTPENERLLADFDQASRDLGLGPVVALDPGERGAADISFVPKGVAQLDGLGPVGGGGHTEQEWIDLDTLHAQTRRVALLLARVLARPR